MKFCGKGKFEKRNREKPDTQYPTVVGIVAQEKNHSQAFME
jgi:hypothetical protein